MKKVLFAILMLAGLNLASVAQTTPAKKEAAKTEVKQQTKQKEMPKKSHKKTTKHHKKHKAAKTPEKAK